MAGYITLPRDFQYHWIWDDCRHIKWMLTLVFQAAWTERKYPFGGRTFALERGQLVTSIRLLASKFGCSTQTAINFLDTLESARIISRLATPQGTIITILDYAKFQPPNGMETSLKSHSSKRKLVHRTEQKEEVREAKNTITNDSSLTREEECEIFESLRQDDDYWKHATDAVGIAPDILKQRFEEFYSFIIATNHFHKDESDLRQHFLNTVKKMETRPRASRINNTGNEGKFEARRATPPTAGQSAGDDSVF